jgi:hypothetical protein
VRATIVIPSYWGRASGEPLNLEDAVYDHPTPLEDEGTLGRALESIRVLDNSDFNVVVLACATSPDIAADVEARVTEIAAPLRAHYPLAVLSHAFERRVKEKLELPAGGRADAGLVSLTGYSNIRNMCLIAAELARSEVAVLFDDDEVYEDPRYLDKVFEDIEAQYRGGPVRAVAGYYLRPDGGYLLPPPADWWMTEWPMERLMNQAFGMIAREPRLKPTPFVFGGNMVIHRDVFRKIAFDPNVRRGEDIDFLTNCKFFGIDFLLDRELAIKHLPPGKSPTMAWQHFRENIYRFVYAREKLRRQAPGEGLRPVEVEELDPYPGGCMRDDLEDMVFKTSVLMGLEYLHRGDELGFAESMRNIQLARHDAPPAGDPFAWYLDCRARWESLMSVLDGDEVLSAELLESMS